MSDRVSAIRGSRHVWPGKLKRPPLPFGVRRRMWDIRSEDPDMSNRGNWNVGGTEFFTGWNELCRVSLSEATPSGFPKRTRGALPYLDSLRDKHTALPNITPRTIAYPIRICCPNHWLKWASLATSFRQLATTHVPLPSDGVSGRPVRTSFAMDSKKLSSISDCFDDQKAIKTPKLNTIWLELIARVLSMLIGLKGDNYYSKVFKGVNYKLSNNTFWVVINSI